MKFGILHLSDMHINAGNAGNAAWILDRAKDVAKAVKLPFAECEKIYIVVSGDIANIAAPSEYKTALDFFRELLRGLACNFRGMVTIENKILCVPGNHDLDLSSNKKIRSVAIDSVADSYPSIDDSIFETIVAPQKNFEEYMNKQNSGCSFTLALVNEFDDDVNGFKIRFNLYNTAWMSLKKEVQGSIFMPIAVQAQHPENVDMVISVMHHYYDWMSASKSNKSNFKHRIENSSNILLYGHEHEINSISSINHLTYSFVSEFEASAFFEHDAVTGKEMSGFQTLVTDTESSSCTQTVFDYDLANKVYKAEDPRTNEISNENKNDVFRISAEFIQHLDEMPTPIYNHENEKLKLSEIFIYPDLETMNESMNKTDIDGKYKSSEELFDDKEHKLFILEGGNQCGKTSLCNMFYMWLSSVHLYPLMLSGKDINNANIKRILRNAYDKQYMPEFAPYDKYEQYEDGEKVLLIDNFDKCQLKKDVKETIVKELLLLFDKVIITVKEDKFVVDSLNYFSKDATRLFQIKSFGYEKRAKLVEKFYEKYSAGQCISEQEMLDKTNEALRMVQQFLGKEYIPPYPIYILSLLLSSIKMLGLNYAQTAYGHCYDAIITCALLTQVVDDDVSQYRNFLKHFAYYKFINKKESLSEDELKEFYDNYSVKYAIVSFNICKNVLLNSGLLICEDDYYYKFGYKYVYYFTVAEHISGIVNQEEGKEIIRTLCNKIDSEENANILIFLTYHIDDVAFIDENIFTLMLSIEDVEPITLRKNDVFYISIEKLCKELKTEAVDVYRKSDPKAAREKTLKQQDAIEREKESLTKDEEGQSEQIRKIDKALKAIDVVGQIIKNRRNSLEKDKLREMMKELYFSAFRTVNYLGKVLSEDKKQLLNDILEDKKISGDTLKIRSHIDFFFQMTTFRFCLFIFTKIINSVGVKDLRWLYNAVSKQINTPAAEIVTFSIESVYSKLSVEELRELVEKYKDNSAVMTIICARVRSYLYNNYVEYKDRERIAKVLRLDSSNNRITHNIPSSKGNNK